MARVFLTGASGFLGREVLLRLRQHGHHVVSLQRRQSEDRDAVTGELAQPSTWEHRLAGADVVVHLAAVTGKAAAREYVDVNVEGTRALLAAARRTGCSRFLFCSTIAVTFADIADYPYARSKKAAEDLVRQSGLRSTIVRPTIIAGPGSPVLSKLAALAALPVVPLFGGGRAMVQPILAADLASLIVDIVETDAFDGETIELGGRDALTVRELLDALHRGRRGGRTRFVPVPVQPLLPVLRGLEAVFGPRLPITVGQLATFRFDGLARTNRLWERWSERLATTKDVVALSVAPAEAPGTRSVNLAEECRTFTRLLIGRDPTPYVMAKYAAAHDVRSDLRDLQGFDRQLVERAAAGPRRARLADAYARRAMPRGGLRRKLVLLLAILEASPGVHTAVDRTPARPGLVAAVEIAMVGLVGVSAAVAGLVWFGAIRLVSRRS